MLNQDEILRGRYRVIRRLGQGGMGAVYEAHDNVFDTSVALKEVIIDLSNAVDTKAQEMAQAAFEREAKLLAKINHETIPHVKDYFIEENGQFLVMELVDGDDLAKLLKERNSAFPVSTLLEWTDQLLEALDYLHTQEPPIIHRDIKPQNLKLTSRKKIKLLDFGIAKGTESHSLNTVTNQTFVAATLNYSPIEQMIRVLDPTFLAVITHKYGPQVESILRQNADVRSDLFALGATIYHLATNKHPAEAIKRGVEIWDGNPDPLEDPRLLNPEISVEFSAFLVKAMQISRDHRFASATEMRGELHRLMDVPTQQSLKPTVDMKFEPLSGDATTPMIQMPAVPGSNAENTLGTPAPSSPAEFKTEVIDPDTARRAHERARGITGGGGVAQADDSGSAPPRKKRSKLLWLIPVAGILLFIFAGGVLGVLVVVNQMSKSAANANEEVATPEETPEPTPVETPEGVITTAPAETPDTSSSPGSGPDQEPARPAKTSTSDKPAPFPTRRTTPVFKATPKPRTPTPKPPPTKTPKKNMDCIFTDSC